MDNEQTITRVLVSAAEQAEISRSVLRWLNSYPDKPRRVDFEFLGKTSGLCLSTVQTAFKTKQFINGGYQAQYSFQIVYRIIAENNDDRLTADEVLDTMGEWAETNVPEVPTGINRWKVKRDTGAAIMARYDNNAEDHTIQMTLIYEVIN